MTNWKEPRLLLLSGAFDAEVKVVTAAKEGRFHDAGSTYVYRAVIPTS